MIAEYATPSLFQFADDVSSENALFIFAIKIWSTQNYYFRTQYLIKNTFYQDFHNQDVV